MRSSFSISFDLQHYSKDGDCVNAGITTVHSIYRLGIGVLAIAALVVFDLQLMCVTDFVLGATADWFSSANPASVSHCLPNTDQSDGFDRRLALPDKPDSGTRWD